MRFWDSSALVPLVSDEDSTDALTALAASDRGMLVSSITPVEVLSAIWRKARTIRDERVRARSHARLAALQAQWVVVSAVEDVIADALDVVARHGLRGADAIQLASARFTRNEALPFVTLDHDLRRAARAEGFPTLP